MFNKIVATLLLLVTCAVHAGNKEGQVNYNASTGDTKLDLSLGKLDLKADGNINEFIKALGFEYQVPTAKIEKLVFDYNFTASDAYMAVSIGNVSGRSIDDVADIYKSNRAKGWGFVAKQMGIKPGSKAFHQLKNGSTKLLAENSQEESNETKNNKEMKDRPDKKGKGKEKTNQKSKK